MRERLQPRKRERLTPPLPLAKPRRRKRERLLRDLPEDWVKSTRRLAKKQGILAPKLLDRHRWDEKRWKRHERAWEKFTRDMREEQKKAQERWRQTLHELKEAKAEKAERRIAREARKSERLQRKAKKGDQDFQVLSCLDSRNNTVRRISDKLDLEMSLIRQ